MLSSSALLQLRWYNLRIVREQRFPSSSQCDNEWILYGISVSKYGASVSCHIYTCSCILYMHM